MIDKKCCFKPYGKVYIAPVPDACPTPNDLSQYGLIEVGNVTEITRNMAFNEIDIPNLQTPAFGKACEFKVLESETLDFVLTCVKTENLKIALGGTTTSTATAVVTDEEHQLGTDVDCVFVPTQFLIDTSVAVVVTDDDTPTPNTFTLGTDYFVRSSGIELTENTTIPPSTNLLISYTRLDQTRYNTSVVTPNNYIIHFDGNNAVDGTALAFTYFNVKFDPAETLALLSEDFLTLPVTGEALLSPCFLDNQGNGLRSTFDMND